MILRPGWAKDLMRGRHASDADPERQSRGRMARPLRRNNRRARWLHARGVARITPPMARVLVIVGFAPLRRQQGDGIGMHRPWAELRFTDGAETHGQGRLSRPRLGIARPFDRQEGLLVLSRPARMIRRLLIGISRWQWAACAATHGLAIPILTVEASKKGARPAGLPRPRLL